jgi:hypothetical protein
MEKSRTNRRRSQSGMSYKFQRLRERIRHAVSSGELSGKLPGERELARRFHVNAKTLSKALTDLAAEGLLQRSIGRGTFVKGSEPEPTVQGPWLIVCDEVDADSQLVRNLRKQNPAAQVVQDVGAIRPSFLNQFVAVVDLSLQTPEAFLRDLIVRNIALVTVDRRPKTYSTSSVVIDIPFAAYCLGRDLLLAGHRRLVAIEGRGNTAVAESLRAAAARYAPDASIDHCYAKEINGAVEVGATAAICDSMQAAREAMDLLARASIPIPQAISLAAIGHCEGRYPCTGFFASATEISDAIIELLNGGHMTRTTTLWLPGRAVNMGTIASIAGESAELVVHQSIMQRPMLTLEAL